MGNGKNTSAEPSVPIIAAGFGGIRMGIKLKRAGILYTIIETCQAHPTSEEVRLDYDA